MKEDTVLGSMIGSIHRHVDNLAGIDSKDGASRKLPKFILMQIVITIVPYLFWWLGMLLAIIYDLALSLWLKQKFNTVQYDYRTLLKQTQGLKEGGFQAEFPQDIDIFNVLKDEFSEIRVGFEKAVREGTKSQNTKTRLVSNAPHDLRTSLTGARNYIELLQQEGISETQCKEYVSMLDQYAKRLHAPMGDLFEASRADNGDIQLDMAHLDIIALVEQVQAKCSELLQECGLGVLWNLHGEEQLSVLLDGGRAFRVFGDLFINIHHYVLEYTCVYADIRKMANRVWIECKNISKEPLSLDMEDIVDRFIRGDKSRHDGGSGLGLAIAKSFTKAVKGSFRIKTDGDLLKVAIEFPLVNDTSGEDQE